MLSSKADAPSCPSGKSSESNEDLLAADDLSQEPSDHQLIVMLATSQRRSEDTATMLVQLMADTQPRVMNLEQDNVKTKTDVDELKQGQADLWKRFMELEARVSLLEHGKKRRKSTTSLTQLTANTQPRVMDPAEDNAETKPNVDVQKQGQPNLWKLYMDMEARVSLLETGKKRRKPTANVNTAMKKKKLVTSEHFATPTSKTSSRQKSNAATPMTLVQAPTSTSHRYPTRSSKKSAP